MVVNDDVETLARQNPGRRLADASGRARHERHASRHAPQSAKPLLTDPVRGGTVDVRTFTLDEANALLPQVAKGLDAAKDVLDQLRDVRDQLADLRIVWGDGIDDAACPDHAEYVGFRDRFVALEADMADRLRRIADLGCEVKDPDQGLVDFYAKRRDDVVYLCWKRGERRIGYWHTLVEGYAGRQPMTAF